jgi:hypothetical protein
MSAQESNGNGIHEFPRAATPELSADMHAAATGEPISAEDFLEAIASKLAKKVGGGDGHGGPPKKEFLGLTGGGWTKFLSGMIIAAVVTAGTWVLLVRDTLKEHADAIQENGSTIDDHAELPMHPDAATQINGINIRIEGVEDAVKDFRIQQTKVIDGIEDLKKENVKKLTDELDELKRENRRLERTRPPRSP